MVWTILSGLGRIAYRTALELSPTVVSGVQKGHRLFKEEVFGPILLVTPFDTEEEALVLVSGTDYGLSAYASITRLLWEASNSQEMESTNRFILLINIQRSIRRGYISETQSRISVRRHIMTKPTLLFISMGELATHLLEAIARTDIFSTIVVASRDFEKAQKRVNNAVLGAGIEGHFPRVIAEQLDVHSNDFSTRLREINPDFIFSAPSLLPWWKLAPSGIDIPFAGYTALHLSLMQKFRNQIAMANVNSVWIGASFPDVINAMLNRTGFGPDYGIGNVQEPIAKIQMGIGRLLNCAPIDVDVKLVAQHSFEYFVLNDHKPDQLPPYLLKATLAGKDVTQIAETVLREAFPFPYDLHFNRVTASSGLVALQALTGETEKSIHLPGIGALVGGYPVRASTSGITIDLPDEWSLEQAIAVNEASLKWDGIDEMAQDGTIVFTAETQLALHKLLGKNIETLSTEIAQDQANDLLNALR